ncbi:hypothetical protein INT45_004154 [Circinella minor]|uniref:non-specific serine/threonine protein kinase n=1 Tax=Circinella minor TaxID=1195481 RepID=A0A8H7S1P6_9FUNG|nr:hypothetical protein INT45_004154 [Circinella minor]
MSPTLTDDSSARTDSLDGSSNKFWRRPSEEQFEDSSLEPEDVFFIDDDNYPAGADNDDDEESNNLWLGQQNQATSTTQKRRQTKMLLVVLIESFCSVYGERPEANHKIFFLICQTLRSLGLIDSEFVDEMSNVRSTYQSAFQRLFYTAVQTVRNRELFQRHQRMIMQTPWDDTNGGHDDDSFDDYKYDDDDDDDDYDDDDDFMQPPSISETTALSSEQLLFNLSVQNSRYRNDFVEINMLGKGGFASVWRARNKLDGIDYAVKKIRLGNTLDTGRHAPYEKIFREIKHLARLEHKNVVRYYSSWLELAAEDNMQEVDEDEDYVEDYEEEEEEEDSVFNGHDPMFDDHEFSINFDESSLDNHNNDTVYEESRAQIRFAENSDVTDSATDSNTLCKPRSNNSRVSKTSTNHSGFDGEWVLYIQMQLCPATLHDYIKFRNQHGEVDSHRNIEIFTQILEGAAYIHSLGVIHRDLKPTNIFLSMPPSMIDYPHRKSSQASLKSRSRANSLASLSSSSPSHYSGGNSGSGCSNHDHTFSFDSVLTPHGLRACMWDEPWMPKIGDFGLAAAMEDAVNDDTTTIISPTNMLPSSPVIVGSPKSQSSNNSNSNNQEQSSSQPSSSSFPSKQRPSIQRKHTVGVGTRTYASPEQLAHTPNAYDEKVDIYSLGIIFFELYKPFSTAMERASEIEHLKNGVFPDGFVEKYPKESALILWMMDVNPDCRPTAAQLLDFELFNTAESTKNDSSFASLQSELQAKSLALDKKTQEMAALCVKMERLEMEKQREMSLMQQEKIAMQQRLLELEQKLKEKTTSNNNNDATALSSPLLTPTSTSKVITTASQ